MAQSFETSLEIADTTWEQLQQERNRNGRIETEHLFLNTIPGDRVLRDTQWTLPASLKQKLSTIEEFVALADDYFDYIAKHVGATVVNHTWKLLACSRLSSASSGDLRFFGLQGYKLGVDVEHIDGAKMKIGNTEGTMKPDEYFSMQEVLMAKGREFLATEGYWIQDANKPHQFSRTAEGTITYHDVDPRIVDTIAI